MGIAAAIFVYHSFGPTSSSQEKRIIEVQQGPFGRVSQELEQKGLIKNKRLFDFLAHVFGYDSKIKIGEYEVSKNMSAREILELLASGKNLQRTFTIPEGYNIFEIAEIFELKNISKKEDFLKFVQDPKNVQKYAGISAASLEGYLYPDTYYYTKQMKMDEIIEAMIKNLNKNLDNISNRINADKKLRHRIITLASVVEKETGAPEERPVIASVFYNRLAKKMKLQSDPTIIYGLEIQRGGVVKNIRKADILSPTPYNTYVIAALPVGPIANPGRASVEAVLKPAKTDFLYFVSMNEGRHHFSKDYQGHQEAVIKYQKDKKSRDGKSWRNMKIPNATKE